MTIISPEPEYAAYLLGIDIEFENAPGIKLIQPTSVNDIAIKIKWKDGDLKGKMNFSVYYYNLNTKRPVIINYSAPAYELNEIMLISLVDKEEINILCTNIIFQYWGASKEPVVPMAITVSKFDSEKEKADYRYQALNHHELGFPMHVDFA